MAIPFHMTADRQIKVTGLAVRLSVGPWSATGLWAGRRFKYYARMPML